MINAIYFRLRDCIFRFNRYVLRRYQFRKMHSSWNTLSCNIHTEYCNFVETNRNIDYFMEIKWIPFQHEKHKWVGGVLYEDYLYAIPNDSLTILKIHVTDYSVSFVNGIKNGLFKWTGGTVYNRSVVAFPRQENYLLQYYPHNEQISLLDIDIDYKSEHHYGGVCTTGGYIYQPPRNTDHILRINLKNKKNHKIQISPRKLNRHYRYCGSILHPNGFIYFFPENNMPVIKLNPINNKWCFIDKPINTMTFNAKVATDGNIYGFSAYEHGLMKIDVENDKVEMIHKEIKPGAYGTKLGIDGCLYSIPGDGKHVWKYDPKMDRLTKLFKVEEQVKAKYAGGSSTKNGIIFGIPAESNSIMILRPNVKTEIPASVFSLYFNDCY